MIIKKVTTGFVIQSWDIQLEQWVSQEFIAGDQVAYEIDDKYEDAAEFVQSFMPDPEPYLPFNVVQPEEEATITYVDLADVRRQGEILAAQIIGNSELEPGVKLGQVMKYTILQSCIDDILKHGILVDREEDQ